MTTIANIITTAYRESGIIPVGISPSTALQTEALNLLQTLLRSFLGAELGENFQDLNYGSGFADTHQQKAYTQEIDSWYVPSNVRLTVKVTSPATVYLDPDPMDGSRLSIIDGGANFNTVNFILNANGKKIETANTLTLNTASVNREWFYRADLGSWQRVTDVTTSDSSPFPVEFDDLLTTMLAMRLNPRYGTEISPLAIATLDRLRRQFRARYRQSKQVSSELSLQIHPGNWWRRYSVFPLK